MDGDVADARGPLGQKPAWLLPKGTITFHHGPGHAPGHVSIGSAFAACRLCCCLIIFDDCSMQDCCTKSRRYNSTLTSILHVQVSYLHIPSGSLVAGDVFGNLGNPPTITLPPSGAFWCKIESFWTATMLAPTAIYWGWSVAGSISSSTRWNTIQSSGWH